MMSQTKVLGALGLGMLVLVAGTTLLRRTPVGDVPLRRLPPSNGEPREAAPAAVVSESPASAGVVVSGSGGEGPQPPTVQGLHPDVASRRALRHAEQDFWEDLGVLLEARSTLGPAKYREAVSAMTAEYLEWDRSRSTQFDHVADQATETIAQAWKSRNEEIVALRESQSAEERADLERQIQERYEEAKGHALSRLETLLGNSPRHEHFRQRLGEWFDAVR
jgi:hypothetical protein